jgi:hypothetical protein
MPASGRHSRKGHRGKREKSVTPHLLRISARFLLPELRVEIGFKVQGGKNKFSRPPTESFCCPLCRHVENNVAVQRNFQVPKLWSGRGDTSNLGVLDLFARERGGGACGRPVCAACPRFYTHALTHTHTHTSTHCLTRKGVGGECGLPVCAACPRFDTHALTHTHTHTHTHKHTLFDKERGREVHGVDQ